ncbi:protein of unknown function [Paenibacillus alvei]|uniref:Uncharacterized protein n=1 Tax=Paenibacillus alvei TaxID=44250 RepID=A0A383R3I3_PAEAL|nr:protein of unknown function [Paenibacillus alvei]
MLLDELQEYCEISTIKGMKDWYFYSNKTPAFIFTHYLNFSLLEGYPFISCFLNRFSGVLLFN